MVLMNSENTTAANQVNNQTQSQLGALAIIGAPPPPGVAALNQASTVAPQQ
jgi:hypothetical protein